MVVGCVCLSVKSHLTSGASVRPENSAGNGGQKICGFFSETAPLWSSSTPSVESTICLQKVHMRIITTWWH